MSESYAVGVKMSSTAYLLLEIDAKESSVTNAFIASSTYNTISRIFDGNTILVEAIAYPGGSFHEAYQGLLSELASDGINYREFKHLKAVQDMLESQGYGQE